MSSAIHFSNEKTPENFGRKSYCVHIKWPTSIDPYVEVLGPKTRKNMKHIKN